MTASQPNRSFNTQQGRQNFQINPGWQPVPSHREDHGRIKVVWLQGTPYEMGYQHGQLLHDEIRALPRWFITLLNLLAKQLGLSNFARRRSFPDVIEECEGLAAATVDLGLTPEAYLAVALGDVFQAFIKDTPLILLDYKIDPRKYLPAIDLGCSQFVAAGAATPDQRLYYGINLDCPRKPMQYWLNHTTVFVRQPNQGIPHVSIAVPGAVWCNAGLNLAGVSLALNTAYPAKFSEFSLQGCSHVQMMAQILQYASSYEAARSFMITQKHMIANLIVIADGKTQQAGVFEFTAHHRAIRELSDRGLVYVTNHFISPEMQTYDRTPSSPSSLLRYQRLQQLLEPEGAHSRYGRINLAEVMNILRDRTNPYTFQESPPQIYDDHSSIATNGLLRQVIFDPAGLQFWIATGEVPVYTNPFIHLSLTELLDLP